MLSHLIYASKRTRQCDDAEIAKILDSCRRNNPKVEVTGVLLYSPSTFVQYIEGEYSKISQLYDKIRVDPRHTNAVLISSAPIKSRMFPSWQMGSRQLDFDKIEFVTDITADDQKVFHEILSGKSQEGGRVIPLIQKFFK